MTERGIGLTLEGAGRLRWVLIWAVWIGILLLSVPPAGAQSGQAGDQREIRKVAGRFAQALEKEDWPTAIQLGHELVRLSPTNHVHPYNLACAYARSGAADEALEWLRRAAQEGFSDPDGLRADDDLVSLRASPAFEEALAAVQANYDRARALFLEMAKGSEALVVAPEKASDGALPVLFVLHGYGGSTDRFMTFLGPLADRLGLVVVGVRSVIPTPNRGFEWGTPVDAGVQIRSALEQVTKARTIDRQRLYLLGFSQGGRMALEASLTDWQAFRGVIAIGAGVRRSFAEEPALKDAPPLFFMVGGDDRAVASNRLASKKIKKAGHPIQLRVYPGVGHAFPQGWEAEVRKAIRWFDSR